MTGPAVEARLVERLRGSLKERRLQERRVPRTKISCRHNLSRWPGSGLRRKNAVYLTGSQTAEAEHDQSGFSDFEHRHELRLVVLRPSRFSPHDSSAQVRLGVNWHWHDFIV